MGEDYCTGGDDQMGGDDRSYSRNGTILAIYIYTRFHILQGQALTISSYKFSSRREFTFIFFLCVEGMTEGLSRKVLLFEIIYVTFLF